MLKFSKKHKDKLIGGLIGVFIMALGLFVKNYFTPTDKTDKLNDTVKISMQSPVINNIGTDSARQTINQVTQTNKNKGDVKNEFISGDKKVYNNYSHRTKSDTQIVNNGFINKGGTGNTYNQTINPEVPQRHFTQESYGWFEKNIPQKAKYFSVTVYNYDEESMAFANEIFDFLQAKKYIAAMTPAGQIISQPPKNKIGQIDVGLTPDSTMFQMTIYPLK